MLNNLPIMLCCTAQRVYLLSSKMALLCSNYARPSPHFAISAGCAMHANRLRSLGTSPREHLQSLPLTYCVPVYAMANVSYRRRLHGSVEARVRDGSPLILPQRQCRVP